jgi:hypothetical protein
VRAFVNLSPARGISRDAIEGPAQALGYAHVLLDALRSEARDTSRFHLFQAGPVGLALLLGHVWNRLPEPQLYDDLGSGRGYASTFRLAA